MTIQTVAAAYNDNQRRIAALADARAADLWAMIDPADISGSWAQSVGPATVRMLSAAQQLAAAGAPAYVQAALDAQDAADTADAAIDPAAFAGAAADGRPLSSLLYLPVIDTKTALGVGSSIGDALAAGGRTLSLITVTETADAGRDALQAQMTATRTVHGYVRMVSGAACSRCIILAGRFYRYNASFQRHPHCQCTGIPAVENRPDFRTDPHAFFDHLTRAEQDARFGAADAEAIRNGADIYQVVNAHRGIYSVGDVYGRPLELTGEGVTKRGLAGQRLAADRRPGAPTGLRLSVREIYRQAGDDRQLAMSLLRKYGYIR